MDSSNNTSQNNVEVELRSEISPEDFVRLKAVLENTHIKIQEFKRLSVLFFNDQNNQDIRIRVDSSGNAESVVKHGEYHSSKRAENAQSFSPEHFLDIVESFALLGYPGKIIERETVEFDIGNGALFSLVLASPLAYTELEIMSSKETIEENLERLKELSKSFNLTPISKKESYDLCSRLGDECDIVFDQWTHSVSVELKKRLTPYLLTSA